MVIHFVDKCTDTNSRPLPYKNVHSNIFADTRKQNIGLTIGFMLVPRSKLTKIIKLWLLFKSYQKGTKFYGCFLNRIKKGQNAQ